MGHIRFKTWENTETFTHTQATDYNQWGERWEDSQSTRKTDGKKNRMDTDELYDKQIPEQENYS